MVTKSFGKLSDMIEAASEHKMSNSDLFRALISRILLETLPESVSKNLIEVRHKITEKDTINDLLQVTLSVLYGLVNTKGKQAQTKQMTQEKPSTADYGTLLPSLVAAIAAGAGGGGIRSQRTGSDSGSGPGGSSRINRCGT